MKKILLLTGIICAYNLAVFSQGNEIDAYTLSNTELSGTARSMAMGGAFGALGGDISVISINPAGLGIYRSSEVNGTLSFSAVNASTKWLGTDKKVNGTNYSYDNLGVELYLPTGSESILNWNIGFSYNRTKNFFREIKTENRGMPNSIGDFVAKLTDGTSEDLLSAENNPYGNPKLDGKWLSILGYDSYMIDPDKNRNGKYIGFFGGEKPTEGYLRITESGNINDYNIGLGMNISNILFLGTSLSVSEIYYKLNSAYEEYDRSNRKIYLDNLLTTEGKGYSLNLGAILNLQMLRLGVAYSTPKWYNMTDYFDAFAATYLSENDSETRNTPEDSYTEYRFKTPDKWTFSAALILGRAALISADYELTNYKNMKYLNLNGGEYEANDYIREDFNNSHVLRVGGELKVTPQLAVRAGYSMQTSPMGERLVNSEVAVAPSGTIPHFVVSSSNVNYYTAGLGYRFTPNLYLDLACIYRTNEAKVYAFSSIPTPPISSTQPGLESTPASLTNNSTRVALTFGCKF